MAKKKLKSGFQLEGIAPNILLQYVDNTAPFLFKKKLKTNTKETAYLEKMIFYKKNLKQLNNLNLPEYFQLCLSAHWGTAGTFVPTDVDKQIREGLWRNSGIKKHILKMADITIASLKWDYTQLSKRVSYNQAGKQIFSTHEGTWFSVAIGAYCALVKNDQLEKAQEVADVIMQEVMYEKECLDQLFEAKEYINFIKAAPLVAHNFGDLDRVMVAWDMHESDEFCKSIYKLGHEIKTDYNEIIVFAGMVNKEFTAHENHRHMALRKPKCLRKSHEFLIQVGPFFDDWGKIIADTNELSIEEKAEVIVALYEGYKREKEAFGYARAYAQIMHSLKDSQSELDQYLSFDLIQEISKSEFKKIADLTQAQFEESYMKRLKEFECPKTSFKFN